MTRPLGTSRCSSAHKVKKYMKKRHWLALTVAFLLLAIWSAGSLRITGRYSIRSHAVEPLGGSSLTHLQLNGDGSGIMWGSEGGTGDFRVIVSWTKAEDGIDLTIPEYKHWSYCYFNSPGVHHFVRQGARLTAVGKKEANQLQPYGVHLGLPAKIFVFKKDILQI